MLPKGLVHPPVAIIDGIEGGKGHINAGEDLTVDQPGAALLQHPLHSDMVRIPVGISLIIPQRLPDFRPRTLDPDLRIDAFLPYYPADFLDPGQDPIYPLITAGYRRIPGCPKTVRPPGPQVVLCLGRPDRCLLDQDPGGSLRQGVPGHGHSLWHNMLAGIHPDRLVAVSQPDRLPVGEG